MKKAILFLMFIFFIMANVCLAGDVSLAWDENTEADLVGYKVYTAPNADGPYTWIGTTPKNSTTIKDLDLGTHYFVVTAYNEDNLESGYSNEVARTLAAPGSPQNLRGVAITIHIE